MLKSQTLIHFPLLFLCEFLALQSAKNGLDTLLKTMEKKTQHYTSFFCFLWTQHIKAAKRWFFKNSSFFLNSCAKARRSVVVRFCFIFIFSNLKNERNTQERPDVFKNEEKLFQLYYIINEYIFRSPYHDMKKSSLYSAVAAHLLHIPCLA